MELKDFEISARAKSCLLSAGYTTTEEVRKLTRDEMAQIHNMNQQCIDEVLEAFTQEIVIDKCVYRLYEDGYHMVKVTDTSIACAVVPKSIHGIQVTCVGKESILEVARPGFWECENLREVRLPEGLMSVGGFFSCNSLKQIAIPDTVTEVTSNAFELCCRLESIALPAQLKGIGPSAFSGCGSLKNLYLPSNVDYLGEQCFFYSGLEYIVFPDNLEHLNDEIFMGCEDLKEITFPRKLKTGEITTNIFCSDIEFPDFKEMYSNIMSSLKVVRVGQQNKEEAMKLFGRYGIIVQVI